MTIGKRSLPAVAPLSVRPTPDSALSATYKLTFATPMFGGGTRAAVVDTRFPVRSSSVRGQLRFWWRALNAARFPSVAACRQREFEIFGGPDFPSPTVVRVSCNRNKIERRSRNETARDFKDKLVPAPFGFDQFGPENYALFSAKNNTEHASIDLLKEGFSFELNIAWADTTRLAVMRARQNEDREKQEKPRLPDAIADIGPDLDAAIKAWVMWSGLGSRTRRGVGSLHCPEISTAVADDPCLVCPPGSRLFLFSPNAGKDAATALSAWHIAVDNYQRFRQSFREPRKRSRWPEPDSIRTLTGCTDPNHKIPMVTQAVPNFPRAVLGLPIGFQFIGGPQRGAGDPAKDPASVVLVPKGSKRMGSPVITKAVFVDDRWQAAILILPHDHAMTMNVELRGGTDGAKAKWNSAAHRNEDLAELIPAAQVTGPAMATLGGADNPMHGHDNAVDALIGFLGKPSDGQGEKKAVFTERLLP